MKAMILSAGYGKRLLPLTKNCPKSLLTIGRETLLSNTIKFLIQCGVKQVIINVHYLAEQIIDYINKNKFNLSITIVNEEEKILDTGGGILNAIKNFNEPFLVINPDTIWSSNHIKDFKLIEKFFFKNKHKCSMLLVNKLKCTDKSFKGDFSLKNNLVNRNEKNNLNYIYTGLQIIRPEVFSKIREKVFSINKVWDKLISTSELYGVESNIDFLHVSNIDFYKVLSKEK